ncbi:O-sialoglycoprotein endopeptidase [Emergencia timonensis]|uniref:O-sialoglycoprotein endopeptidase n=1 Tax=Emergencia timonensis TaxID=1776384 RepID=UPI00399484B6
MNSHYSFGIDTSNYKTSVAIVDTEGNIICNFQKYLDVKKGERGLRQSAALFQHVNNLPALVQEAFDMVKEHGKIDCVCVSERPRPQAGSYMPVFNAGVSAGKMLAAALDAAYLAFSHQEGHIEAVKHDSKLKDTERMISFHFSGGTSEALLVDGESIEIVGGSKDLAFGQVLDRVGVALGMDFPCGQELDELAIGHPAPQQNLLPKIKCQDGYINLSGIETKCQRMIDEGKDIALVPMLFQRLGQSIEDMTKQLRDKYDIRDFLFAGGVSSSSYIKNMLRTDLSQLNICFGEPALSTDNAVGIARLGGKKIWL